MRRTPALDPGFDAEFPHLLGLALAVCTRMLRHRQDAEDAAAEALARTALRWSQVGALPHREAWVQRVAANVAIDQLRRRRAEGVAAELPVDDRSEPAVLRMVVADALRRLPSRQREVVALHYLVDMSVEQVAEAMGISPNSVKTHLSRAVQALRAHAVTWTKEDPVAL